MAGVPSGYDPVTLVHWLWWKLRCHEGSAEDFQKLFENVIKRAQPEFQANVGTVVAAGCERGGPLRGLEGLSSPRSPARPGAPMQPRGVRRSSALSATPSISQARDLGALSPGEADRFGAGAAMRSHFSLVANQGRGSVNTQKGKPSPTRRTVAELRAGVTHLLDVLNSLSGGTGWRR